MDHDRLFKELLGNFFVEFLELFLPDVAAALDRETALVPMDKEVFTDVGLGEKHEVDVLMRGRFRGEEAFFLVHVENQATAQADFPKRGFYWGDVSLLRSVDREIRPARLSRGHLLL